MHKELSDAMQSLGGCKTPEFRRMTKAPEPKQAPGADEYITISVAEYHCLTKVATMMELIMKAQSYERDAVLRVVVAALDEMTGGGGAEE